jgi:hypothetical protein
MSRREEYHPIFGPIMTGDQKGAVIKMAGYGAAAFAGASVGAEVSKLDGAIQRNPELWRKFSAAHAAPHQAPEHHNLVSYGDVFGPLALGAIIGIALMRKFANPVAEID